MAASVPSAFRIVLLGIALLAPSQGRAAPPPAHDAATTPPSARAAAVPPVLGWDATQAKYCADAITAAEHAHAIPAGILNAIAKVESGRPIATMTDIHPWPWTIDADGTGLFLESKAAAVAWVRQSLTRGARYVDVGCMQVDLQMHPTAFRSLEDAFDPARNADYAARYLRSLYEEAGGNWYVAIGLYHSHTPALAADYRDRVAAVGAGIVRGTGGPEPLYRRALRQGTLHLALAGGGTLRLRMVRRSHLSSCQIAALLDPILAAPARVKPCRPHRGGG